jgi:hypothetical protein
VRVDDARSRPRDWHPVPVTPDEVAMVIRAAAGDRAAAQFESQGRENDRMISPGQVMPMLLEACPSFQSTWETIEDENRDEESPAGRLGYIDAGDFVIHLVRLYQDGTTAEFPAIFAVIERFLIDGDPYVTELAAIGYLEGLQMRAVTDHGIDPAEAFGPYFGPHARQAWDRINRSWDEFDRSRHRGTQA